VRVRVCAQLSACMHVL